MIGSIFQRYKNTLNNSLGSVFQFKEQISGTLWMEEKITSFSGSPISSFLPVEQTNFP